VVLVGVLQRHRRQVGHRLERRQHLAQQGEAPLVDVHADQGRGEQVAVDQLGAAVGLQPVVGG
jgi:hypothetical protein